MKPSLFILAAFLAAVTLLADEPRTAFPGSLAPVPPEAHDLTASQPVAAGEPVTFQIALRLQGDGNAPEAAYQSLVRWLQEQELTINASAFPQHTEIEATGTVAQVSKVLETRFTRMEIGGRSCVVAVSVPSLPNALGGAVVGINGLQPFLHKNKGPVAAMSITR